MRAATLWDVDTFGARSDVRFACGATRAATSRTMITTERMISDRVNGEVLSDMLAPSQIGNGSPKKLLNYKGSLYLSIHILSRVNVAVLSSG